jgi:hypothetical protein
MDRRRASSSLASGLWAATIAVGVFGFAFFVAIVYIG